LRNPTTGIAGCCARAASGHAAAAPPSSVMNSRRLIHPPAINQAAIHPHRMDSFRNDRPLELSKYAHHL
jgi:hypothetical protein